MLLLLSGSSFALSVFHSHRLNLVRSEWQRTFWFEEPDKVCISKRKGKRLEQHILKINTVFFFHLWRDFVGELPD